MQASPNIMPVINSWISGGITTAAFCSFVSPAPSARAYKNLGKNRFKDHMGWVSWVTFRSKAFRAKSDYQIILAKSALEKEKIHMLNKVCSTKSRSFCSICNLASFELLAKAMQQSERSIPVMTWWDSEEITMAAFCSLLRRFFGVLTLCPAGP